ncbi:MAG: DUF4349 domain-containing protein [Spirochaetota bacterium]|nr:DUF4349 domain-containing protein [Spirochaetota bacterium]
MKKKLIKGLLIVIIGFIVLFAIRLLYGYIIYPSTLSTDNQTISISSFNNNNDFNWTSRNIASSKKSYKLREKVFTVDQKYEKIATLGSKTKQFENDEKKVKHSIKKHNAIIQFEQKQGLKGNRRLHLAIGVPPNKFDAMVEDIKLIGKIVAFRTDKHDKTNEYKNLNAKKESLGKTRAALIALKGKGGKIEEFISLENRILNIEEQIQSLGVKLGEYDAENEFCTVKFTLIESGKLLSKSVFKDFLIHAYTAFKWTVKYYFYLIVILVLASLFIWLTLIIIEKTKHFSKFFDNEGK